jgi:hypothetical protein
MKKAAIFVVMLFCSSFVFGANLKSMTKEQVEKALVNKTMTSIPTDNLNGRTIKNTFSMFLDGHGTIFGKMAQKPTNEPQTDKGIYSIGNDGSLYITWQHWDGAKKLCAHFFDTQNAYIAIDCENVFHTVFMKEAVQSGNYLSK